MVGKKTLDSISRVMDRYNISFTEAVEHLAARRERPLTLGRTVVAGPERWWGAKAGGPRMVGLDPTKPAFSDAYDD